MRRCELEAVRLSLRGSGCEAEVLKLKLRGWLRLGWAEEGRTLRKLRKSVDAEAEHRIRSQSPMA